MLSAIERQHVRDQLWKKWPDRLRLIPQSIHLGITGYLIMMGWSIMSMRDKAPPFFCFTETRRGLTSTETSSKNCEENVVWSPLITLALECQRHLPSMVLLRRSTRMRSLI